MTRAIRIGACVFVVIGTRAAFADEAGLWDVSRGAVVTATSPLAADSGPLGMFGGTLGSGPEPMSTIFADGFPAGTVHFTEWTIPDTQSILRFELRAAGDLPDFPFDRSFDHFRLLAASPGQSEFDLVVFESDIPVPYRYLDQSSLVLDVKLRVPVTSRRFRAEFRQTVGAGNSGPRVISLSASGPNKPSQWTVTQLSASATSDASVYGVCRSGYVGSVRPGDLFKASFWSDTSASWTDLSPAGATSATALGIHENQKVGWAIVSGVQRACLWSGAASSWVDLHPPGEWSSQALGVSRDQQVGFVIVGPNNHASLWHGTADSWVDLNPPGATHSTATGVYEGRQVGYSLVGGQQIATIWSGTADSWESLNPTGALLSYARGIAGDEQVGWVVQSDRILASLWTGTAASWVNLDPGNTTASACIGVFGGQQVGYVDFGRGPSAALWSGSASSYLDLHALLPPQFSQSQALSIWSDQAFTYVGGTGYNGQTNRFVPLLWIKHPPCFPDLSGDWLVDDTDFVIFASAYQILDCSDGAMPPDCPADLSADGFVDDSDFVIFATAYESLVCP